jgi:hypothetical protein
MAPTDRTLSFHDDVSSSKHVHAPGSDLPAESGPLREMADTLDGLGSPRMALALRTQAEILSGRGAACGLSRERP